MVKRTQHDAHVRARDDWFWQALLAALKADSGRGLSKDFRDNAFWLHPPYTARDPTLEEWARIETYLADLARAKKGRGRPGTPAYTLTRNDGLLLLADEGVQTYRDRGIPLKTALDMVTSEWAWVPINRTTLATVHNRSHVSLNRHLKRLSS